MARRKRRRRSRSLYPKRRHTAGPGPTAKVPPAPVPKRRWPQPSRLICAGSRIGGGGANIRPRPPSSLRPSAPRRPAPSMTSERRGWTRTAAGAERTKRRARGGAGPWAKPVGGASAGRGVPGAPWRWEAAPLAGKSHSGRRRGVCGEIGSLRPERSKDLAAVGSTPGVEPKARWNSPAIKT
ncbi:translation initiation factor IF-2-like isoform X1 [Ailuropoda melanoleuca]|uniref:translation initiation factor IF-2-like isoform X1 n=1 Tax=Ailuropoda melanoleuca TaxID=9646 RepID=UPI001493E3C4|nr:translation initiation factor IF-2-like isoform X1 [Ailuropoda melanoleuca]